MSTGPAGSSASSGAKSALSGTDADLFEALRKARSAIARDLAVPPYVVFPDATLIGIAHARPVTPEQLLAVSGVGQTKLDRYGDAFLELVEAFEAGV